MDSEPSPSPKSTLGFEAALRAAVAEAVAEGLAARQAPAPAPDPERLLRPQEVAGLLGVSVSQARALMRGELPVVVLPTAGSGEREQRRCRRGDLCDWIAGHRGVKP